MTDRPPAASSLDERAEAAGIQLSYEATDGSIHHVTETAKRRLLSTLCATLPPEAANQQSPQAAKHNPRSSACFMPDWLAQGRCFGVTCQLYGLRSPRNAGIGDFADLAALGEIAAAEGADFLGISPIHALFTAAPARSSPYSPSSRRFLNPFHIALDWIEETDTTTNDSGAGADQDELVDYERVAERKVPRLRRAFARFMACDFGTGSTADHSFTKFKDEGGPALYDFSCFEALSELAVANGGPEAAGWPAWPVELHDKNNPAVRVLCRDNEGRILFHTWLQWIASCQLERVHRHLLQTGMRVGLYLDIAVGVAPDGAETWCEPAATLAEARIGAPPDTFNRSGQNWGLAPLSPHELSNEGSTLFRSMLESCMRFAGAVRLDHVMALERLFLIPAGYSPSDGAYVRYPLEKLLTETAAVSQETETLVIGEDLGTVRPAFRDDLKRAEIQSYRVLPFERSRTGDFEPPTVWPRAALACVATHDLPTLLGWWQGSDIDELAAIEVIDDDERRRLTTTRQQDRKLLLTALQREGLAPHRPGDGDEADLEALAVQVHAYLARTPCRLLAVQLEDLLGMEKQANIPGTIEEHPNWRRRIPIDLDAIPSTRLMSRICEAIRTERPSGK